MTGAPPIPRFTGMVLLWSMPAVLRIEGLSACGSKASLAVARTLDRSVAGREEPTTRLAGLSGYARHIST